MDFVERLFGMSPDGGNGSLETAIFLAAAIGLLWKPLGRAARRLRQR